MPLQGANPTPSFGGFGLKQNYKQIFTYKQWKRLTRTHDFDINATPGDLSFRQWLGLFEFYAANSSGEKG